MKNNRRLKIKLSMLLCVVLAAFCVFMAYSCAEKGMEKFALSTAVYPEMSPYPKNNSFFTSEFRQEAYDKYLVDREKQIEQPALDGFDFAPFTETSMNILLSFDAGTLSYLPQRCI